MRPMGRPNHSGSEDSLAMPIEVFARGRLGTVWAQRVRAHRSADAIELLITDQLPEPELRDALVAAEV